MSRSAREAAEAKARQRFIAVTAIRFAGVGLVMLGFAIVRGVIDLPYVAGAIIAVVGVADIFVVPFLLVRRWKAEDAAGDKGRR